MFKTGKAKQDPKLTPKPLVDHPTTLLDGDEDGDLIGRFGGDFAGSLDHSHSIQDISL